MRGRTPEAAPLQAPAPTGEAPAEASLETLHRLQKFSVTYEFPVVFTSALFDPANPVLVDTLRRLEPDRRHRCLVFVDDGVIAARPALVEEIRAYAARHAAHMALVADPMPVPGGEKIKLDLHFVEHMQRTLFEHRIDRHSYVIAIGGGAVLDAVGLVAATSHRGVRHIRVPTTVLAQDDSGVGVKNGVNLFEVKNFVGTFAPPFAVLNDLDFVEALSPRDKVSGMAEAVKVALIRDADFFRWLERHADDLVLFRRDAMATMIRRCAELHMRQIGQGGDPFETGSARPLDFGHWAAHRLEIAHPLPSAPRRGGGDRHGARHPLFGALGLLEPQAEERIRFLLDHLGFRLWHPALEKTGPNGEHAVMQGLREFREHLGGELTVTLLSGIGTGVEVHEIDEGLMLQAIAWLKERVAG